MTHKILVVDDARTVRQQVAIVLSKKGGYEVVEAEDGEDALAELERHRDIAIVLCDVNMPIRNGIEFVQEARARGFNQPVIMLTTETAKDSIKRAKGAGARAWIVKPFKPDQLLSAIAKLIAEA